MMNIVSGKIMPGTVADVTAFPLSSYLLKCLCQIFDVGSDLCRRFHASIVMVQNRRCENHVLFQFVNSFMVN